MNASGVEVNNYDSMWNFVTRLDGNVINNKVGATIVTANLYGSGVLTNEGSITSLSVVGGYKVVNTGRIGVRGAASVTFSGTNSTLVMAENGSIEGLVDFGGASNALDLSQQDGSTTLEVANLSSIVGGKDYVLQGDKLYMVESRASGSGTLGLGTGQAVTALNSVLDSALSGAMTNGLNSNAPMAYMAAPSLGAAADATLGAATAKAQPSGRVWATAIGGGSAGPDLSNMFGGVVVGSHASLNQNLQVGLLGSYIQSATKTDGDHDLNASSFMFGPYGRAKLGNITVDFSLVGGIAGNETARTINSDVAKANFLSAFVAPSLGVEIPVLITGGTDIALTASASYIAGIAAGYTETGSSQDLTVGEQTLGQLDTRLGLEASFDIANARHVARAGGFYQAHTGNSSIPVSLAGVTRWLDAELSDVYGVYAAYSVGVELDNGLSVTTGIDGSYRNDGVLSGAGRLTLAGDF